MTDRERRLDVIRRRSDRFTELARQYDRLRYAAEKPTSSEPFIRLTEQAGLMVDEGLNQAGHLLELLFSLSQKDV